MNPLAVLKFGKCTAAIIQHFGIYFQEAQTFFCFFLVALLLLNI